MEKRINAKTAFARAAIFLMIAILAFGTAIVPSYADTLGASALKVTNTGERNVMQGDIAELSFELENQTDTPITYDQVELKFENPTGLKVATGNTGTVTLAKKGSKADISFTVEVGRYYKVSTQSYSFTLKNAGEEIYTSRFYNLSILQYTSTGEEGDNHVNGAEIYYSIAPEDGFYRGNGNHISFEVYNSGNNRLKNAVLTLTLPDGIGIDNGSTSANIGYLTSGDTKQADFNIFVEDDVTTGNYLFSAALTGVDSSGGSASFSKSFYIYVNGKDKKDTEDTDGAETNPRLMVNNYSFGANSVEAGGSFDLVLDLLNTSKRNLYNVKVTLTSDGTFVPKGSSNAFYVDKISEKASVSKTVGLSVVPDAEQKTTAITVNMSYEDSDGNTHTSEDTISIKVNQKTRLVVDEIVPPYEVYVGYAGSASLDFYNMGKTVLSNLRVNVEGNFDIMESNSYYAGNMQSGSDDSYSFSFIPREVGPMDGVITFTYDDVEGNQQLIEVPFVFEVMEMPVYEDPWMEEPQPEEKPIPWRIIIFAAVVVLAIAGFIIFKKIRKAKLAKKLELEDAAFEIEQKEIKEANNQEK